MWEQFIGGQLIHEETYLELSKKGIGDHLIIVIEKELGFCNYYKLNTEYRCNIDGKSKNSKEVIAPVWIKVVEIISTTHPDKDVCFTGMIKVEKISPPKKIPLKEFYPDGFESFIKDWAGHEKDPETGKYGYWENPNAKWDWYQLGGRWSGMFKMKKIILINDAPLSRNIFGFTPSETENLIRLYQNNPDKFNDTVSKYGNKSESIKEGIKSIVDEHDYIDGVKAKSGYGVRESEEGHADQALLKNIDFNAMIKEAEEKASWKYNVVKKVFGGGVPKIGISWDTFLDSEDYKEWDIDKKRKAYHGQEALIALSKIKENPQFSTLSKEEKDLISWLDLSGYQEDHDTYVKKAGESAFSTFAVIKDGEWYEKGNMGWWGFVSDEKEKGKWDYEFYKLVKELPEETLLSVYDCHI